MPAAAFRVFLLSPADCSGKRAQMLQQPRSDHDLGRRMHGREGAELGEVFSFVSSLYFRGKLAYASTFARPPRGVLGVHVITPCDGLRAPESPLRADDLRRYAGVDIDAEEARYRRPLLRDLKALAPTWSEAEVVLLGSIASPKYVELLTSVLGDRLFFPADFVGRGDMTRAGRTLRGAPLPRKETAEGDVEGKRPPDYPRRRLQSPGPRRPVRAAEGNA